MAVRGRKRAQDKDPEDAGVARVDWSSDGDADVWHDTETPISADDLEPDELDSVEELEAVEVDEPETDLDEADEAGEADETGEAHPSGEAQFAGGTPDDEDKGKGRQRSKTIARKQMLRERRRLLAQGSTPEIVEYDRPSTRADCREGARPCLYVACRYHLYLDVNPVTGSIKLNFPDREVWELEETCALDVAERGGITLEEVGEIMNLTRERIRQVEVSGLVKLKGGDVSLESFVDGRELPEDRAARKSAKPRPSSSEDW